MPDVEEIRGHRTLPHTTRLTVEAWAPTRAACYAEAARGLVATFADTSQVVVTQTMPLRIESASDEELLHALLEEAIFVVQVLGMVPTDVVVEEADDGGLGGTVDLASVESATLTAEVTAAMSRSGLEFRFDGDLWTCRAMIEE